MDKSQAPSIETAGDNATRRTPSDQEKGFFVDDAMLEFFPQGSKIQSAEAFGHSDWTSTGRVQVKLDNGEVKQCFVKCAKGEQGRAIMHGEFVSLETIQSVSPGLVPKPYGWGKFKDSSRDTYFLIEEFLDMDLATVLDPVELGKSLSQLHMDGKSPNGMYGFHVVTCDGSLPHPVSWEKDWVAFFSRMLQSRFAMDRETNGLWPQLEAAEKQILQKVVPRLLGSLKWQDLPIRPSLIHGDLWSTNVGQNRQAGKIVVYDASCYYAHNEMEVAIWRVVFCEHLWKQEYLQNYLKHFPASEPVGEFEDRLRLYSLKCNLNWSAGEPGCITRETAYNDMCYLCEKYAPLDGIGPYDEDKDAFLNKIKSI